ncbi:NDP-hexose 2,3-dehydratase family protein [Ottowia thiooxydans]|uniref:Oxidase EvaA n=1 Tax=Ottowia thiooxydans TaxID=219182 RepID=A0ABV2QC83_9BURK
MSSSTDLPGSLGSIESSALPSISRDADAIDLLPWLSSRRRVLSEAEDFSLTYMPLESSSHWALEDGAIRHRSGRFFSVIGVRAEDQAGAVVEQALMDQREIGTLALYLRQRDGLAEVLVQFKAEPGNVGLFQLAPSYQATASNTDRVHGGESPPFGDWLTAHGDFASDTLQSEQGTRFFGKRNRNVSLLIQGEGHASSPYHAWVPIKQLCASLSENHLVNTDLRSTLICANWEMLANGSPFAGEGFAQSLRASYELADHLALTSLDDVLGQLSGHREWIGGPEIVSLSALSGWGMREEGPAPLDASGRPFRFRHIQVRSSSREVRVWDQPIVQSAGTGQVVLPVGRAAGVPYFLFKQVSELGFEGRVELTSAVLEEPGSLLKSDAFGQSLIASGRTLVSCKQSEEGGRFLFDENEYALVDVGQAFTPPPGYHWLSVAQICALLQRGCVFTNEARSALSLLLKWI